MILIKLYDEIKKIIRYNYIFIIILLVTIIGFFVEFPYYISAPGKLMDVSDKINLDYEINGSYNMTYVVEYKATLITMLIDKFNKNWDIERKDEAILSHETEEDVETRSKLLLKAGNQIAIINAYNAAKKDLEIINSKVYVEHIDEHAETDLKVGDQIIEIDNVPVNSLNEISELIKDKKSGDLLNVLTDNGIKETKLIKLNNQIKIGISLITLYELDSGIEFKFNSNESGSSGGLMMTLYLYNYLMNQDILNGRKVAGTGTIEIDGQVGEIAGVKYKLIGAAINKAEIFFVPANNYEEAMKVKDENNLDIDIKVVSNVIEAINYLEETK